MSEPTSGPPPSGTEPPDAVPTPSAPAEPAPSPTAVPAQPKKPSRFGRAEGASRRAVLLIGAGIVAYVLGGFVMTGLVVRIGERIGGVTTPVAAWALEWILLRTWAWAVLPAFGWAAGRYLEITPLRFALTAVISGEIFGLLLATASDGLDWVLRSPSDLVMRGVTLVACGALVAAAVKAGITGADAAQQAANLEAEKRKAEYAEFLAKAEGRGER